MSTDLDAALKLAKIAEGASNKRKKDRNKANARRALDTVLKLYRASEGTEDERSFLDRTDRRLKSCSGTTRLSGNKVTKKFVNIDDAAASWC
jgi:hypothetical protein